MAGAAAVGTALCAKALKITERPWLVPTALVRSVARYPVQFYLTEGQQQITTPSFPSLSFSVVTDVKRVGKARTPNLIIVPFWWEGIKGSTAMSAGTTERTELLGREEKEPRGEAPFFYFFSLYLAQGGSPYIHFKERKINGYEWPWLIKIKLWKPNQ